MNIGFDAKRAYLNSSGLGNYSRTLIRSVVKHAPSNNYTLYTTREAGGNFKDYVDEQKNIQVVEPDNIIDKTIGARWRSYGITDLLNQNNIDVYHGLSNELPFNIKKFKGKNIVTIHDLIFLHYPKLYPYIDSKIYNTKFKHACDIADVIIATSEATKRDIEQFYFTPEYKIKVIYQSCSANYYKTYSEEQKKKIKELNNLPNQFLLYVGTIEERKNLLTLVKALRDVKDIPLVVVGKPQKYFAKVLEYITENDLKDRVIFLRDIDNETLPIIYQLATVFIFPSIYEGFGIPILEALTSKTPVITSNGGCFPEVAGPDSYFVDTENEGQMADKINYLLTNEAARNKAIEAGYQYAQQFHPENITKQLLEVYTKD